MTSPNLHRRGRPYRRARAAMFVMYGDRCHLCGHRGARTADHLVPVVLDPAQPVSPFGMRPAHGARNACAECPPHKGKPRACNQIRGIKVPTPVENGGVVALKASREW